MAVFRFKLEGVLRHREHIEREHQRAVSELLARMTAMQAELKVLDDTVSQSTEQLRTSHLTGRIDLGYLTAHRRFMLATHAKAAALMQQMARLGQQIDEARQSLAEAAKQRKIIEKLKEKQFDRWREEQQRKELAALDEIGMQLSYANLSDDEKGS